MTATLPKRPAAEKPPEGSPCNGCGLCCILERCEAAVMAIGEGPGPCPLLTYHDGRHWCQLVEIEEQAGMEPIIRESLGIGVGCSMSDEEAA